MEYRAWPSPLPGDGTGTESALVIGGEAAHRVLIIPPLFDEANKLRRQLVETMRRLSLRGLQTVLPDLPGCNESLSPHGDQTIARWRVAASAAAAHFDATHVLALRSGAWLAPRDRPGFVVAPAKPAQVLRGLIRARIIASREAGREEKAEALLAEGRETGLECGGWLMGPALVRELESLDYVPSPTHTLVSQEELGGAGLWLRAEPGFDPVQADQLAALVSRDILT